MRTLRFWIGSPFTVLCYGIFLGVCAGAEDPWVPVGPGQVQVGGEIGRRIRITIQNNLQKLDIETDFLGPFRAKTGLPESKHTGRYIGLGKLIDATVQFAAYTSDPEIIDLKDSMIRELCQTQLADGYMGIFKPDQRISTYWDLHEMVYLIHGLVADYNHFGNQASLEAARGLADYIMANRQPADKPRRVGKLNTERAFIGLYRATGAKKYLEYGIANENLWHWRDPVAGHAYTFMNLCLAQLDLYRIEPDAKLLSQSHRVIDFLQQRNGLIISGTCSHREAFQSDQVVTGNLGETCATAYLVRLLHHLMCLEGKSCYGDIMERAIYNALFAAQLENGRRLRYFTPLKGKRPVYQWDSYCCPNNFRRIVAQLPRMIYYRSHDGGITVNLYTESSATWMLADNQKIAIRQETDYPSAGQVAIYVDPASPAKFPIRLRIPAWCEQASVWVNGDNLSRPVEAGAFCTISRTWSAGDCVRLDMPMAWRLVRGRKAQQGRAAVLRGPMLFCLNPRHLAHMNPEIPEPPPTPDVYQMLQIDPQSFGTPIPDSTVRPEGLACPVRAWHPGTPITESPDLKLRLTEFADPGGEATYFRIPEGTKTVEDELIKEMRHDSASP